MQTPQTQFSAQWREVRSEGELFFVFAEMTDLTWKFWERSTWEVRLYPVKAAPDLVLKAERVSRAAGVEEN